MTILPAGTGLPASTGPAPVGYVVEAMIEGRMAWLTEPVPLQPYSFSFELEKAHVFERFGLARDAGAAVSCSIESKTGIWPSITIITFDDEYRAWIATDGAQEPHHG